MPISKGKLPTPDEVLRLFRSGKGTHEIARMLNIREAEAYRLLHAARDNERKLDDQNHPAASAVSEQTLAHNENGRDVPLTEIQRVESPISLADHGTSETPENKG
jgi:DNA-binding CsgD family transcriptional regulator